MSESQQSFAAAVRAAAGTTMPENFVASILVELDVECPETIDDASVAAAATALREAIAPAMPRSSPGRPPGHNHKLLPPHERIKTPGSETERVAAIASRYARGGR